MVLPAIMSFHSGKERGERGNRPKKCDSPSLSHSHSTGRKNDNEYRENALKNLSHLAEPPGARLTGGIRTKNTPNINAYSCNQKKKKDFNYVRIY